MAEPRGRRYGRRVEIVNRFEALLEEAQAVLRADARASARYPRHCGRHAAWRPAGTVGPHRRGERAPIPPER